jgi:hypothetical protein
VFSTALLDISSVQQLLQNMSSIFTRKIDFSVGAT